MNKAQVLVARCVLIASFTCLVNGQIEKPQSLQQVGSTNTIQSPTAPSPENTPIVLEGTAPIAPPLAGDIREEQRQQIIRYFLRRIADTPAKRDGLWQPDFSSVAAYDASLRAHRNRLREMLGLIRPVNGTPQITILWKNEELAIEEATLPIEGQLRARALLFLPKSRTTTGAVIAIPPENKTREEFTGIGRGMPTAKWLTALLERNVAVAVPVMTDRRDDHTICRQAGGKDRRRVLWRAGFIVGRTLVGLEVQEVLALRELLSSRPDFGSNQIAVMGEAQGGMTALYAAAVDQRLAAVAAVNYFQQREHCWEEPVDRVLYGQLNEFGDAEVAALISPRSLVVVTTLGGQIPPASVKAELTRTQRFFEGLHATNSLTAMDVPDNALEVAAVKMASLLGASHRQNSLQSALRIPAGQITAARDQQFEALFQYLQNLDNASDQVRASYWQLNSTPPQERTQEVQKLRKELAELVGELPIEPRPMRPRTALIGETDKFLAYAVFLDVAPDLEAYGHILVPRAVAGHVGERLPAVICQHGFDGAPKYVSGVGSDLETNDHFYHRFGERLAERGYVVFAPYLSVPMDSHQPAVVYRADLVNPLVRLAACLGVMRTSIELAKLHRIMDFLQSLPFVESDRIGYYGLSYGGYSAMWMPPLEPRLSLSVISAHFNDWRTMLTDTKRFGDSYWTLPDEDFYNWNALNRFVHTELIAAMWPRPVCIEYGSDDQVTTPEWHQRAWKEVKTFADAWDINEKVVDDTFRGPHAIHGIGTFFFLDRWLRPELPAGRDYGCRDYDYCDETVAPSFRGYVPALRTNVPYATRLLDSDWSSVIRGSFYVSDPSTLFMGMAFKVARNGDPGDLVVRFGSSPRTDDLGQARVRSKDVYLRLDLWYDAVLETPVRLNPRRIYFAEISVDTGKAPNDCYIIFGPKPLGGEDYPSNFGLSFRTLTRK